MAKDTSTNDVQLFPIQKAFLAELLEPYQGVTTALGTPTEPLTVQTINDAMHLLDQHNAEIDSDPEVLGYTASEILGTGVVYAPYVPLYQTPTLNTSDLTGHNPIPPGATFNNDVDEEIFTVKKYNDIYSDIKERFELLDL